MYRILFHRMARNEEGGPPGDVPGIGRGAIAGGVAPTIAGDVEDITILFVDDEQQLLSVLASNLEESIESLDVVTASNATEAVERLESIAVDCVVSDYKMPGTDGLDLLERCREREPHLPFILFTSKGSEDVAVEAINADVTDYLQKDLSPEQLTFLANRIENAVAEQRAREAAEATVQHLRHIHDRVSDAYLGLDDASTITYLDEDAARLLQGDREALLGEPLWDVLPEAVDSPFEAQFERALENDTSVDFETHYEPFGTWFDVRAFPADGGLSVYFRDVTERKRLESAVEDREGELREVVTALEEMGRHSEMLFETAETAEAECTCGAHDDGLLAGLRKLIGGLDTLASMADPDGEESG